MSGFHFHSFAVTSIILLLPIWCSLPCIFAGPAKVLSGSQKNVTACGTLNLSVCKNEMKIGMDRKNCSSSRKVINEYWSKNGFKEGDYINVTDLDIKDNCQVILCDDQELMGYCAHLRPGAKVVESGFGDFLHLESLSMRCACSADDSVFSNETANEDTHFDRNYVGVVYSPYDKYWESKGPNKKLERVAWSNYTEEELSHALENISKKFSLIATYGMGTASNTSEWYEGDKIGLVPKLAAKVNEKLGYPAIRVSVGIFRKDDVHVVWKSKELYNALEASKVANQIFNGTVWGITVTSQYVSDPSNANDTIDMINEVKHINEKENLHLKVGIRISKCSEFAANKRPEDDADKPAYLDNIPSAYVPLTYFQERLQAIAKISDYILCSYLPPSEFVVYPLPEMITIMQNEFLEVRAVLKRINPKLKLIIETGVPSHGIGNGLNNSVHNLREYWYSMAEFAKKEHLMFHMFEAIDQPWKNVQDSEGSSKRYDINGPNGADGFYGWWKRADNSQPAVYIEKVAEGDLDSNITDPVEWIERPNLVKILMLGFFGFIILTLISVGYLWMKLRRAKKQVISPAYVEQFLSGGESCNTKDDNYAVALRVPYDRKYELLKENFHIDKSAVMGSGQSGVVLRGTIKGRSEPVAFKCTSPSSSIGDIKSLMSEIKVLSYIGENNNILCILGAYTRKIERGIVYVALEYCPLGSLESFLRKMDPSKLDSCSTTRSSTGSSAIEYSMVGANGCLSNQVNPGYVSTADISSESGSYNEPPAMPISSTAYVSKYEIGATTEIPRFSLFTPKNFINAQQVDITSLYIWAHQIASAMEYVSEMNVIHADLASRNVLLASIHQVKVCDFGLSRKLYQEMGVVHDKDTPLPWRWMAPEALKHLVFSVESDVWAYGVTLWEIFSLAEVPYHGVTYDMKFTTELEKGMRLPQAKYAPTEINEVLKNCWDLCPNNRPSFTAMKNYFHNLIETKKQQMA